MAKPVTKYTIFVSSPSDLKEERNSMDEVVKELNLTYGLTNDCVIEILKWETHSAPGISNTHTQDIINKDIGDDYDIFLGLLWKRFGTPTNDAESGTEAEFKRALKRFTEGRETPQILFYFKNSVPSSLNNIDPEQLLKVNQFKQSIPKEKMLFWEFDSIENLQNFTRLHIPKRIDTIRENQNIANHPIKSAPTKDSSYLSEDDLGLLDYSEQFENLIADSTSSLNKIADSTEWIGKEINTKTEELNRVSNRPNPNRNVIIGILKRTAKLMNDYSGRLEIETPIFYKTFEDGIKAGINLINIVEDFAGEGTIEDLEESKKSMMILRKSIPKALESLTSFRVSISQLPRIQQDINSAKRKLVHQLDVLIDKLNQSLELSVQYTNEVSNKIDKLSADKEK